MISSLFIPEPWLLSANLLTVNFVNLEDALSFSHLHHRHSEHTSTKTDSAFDTTSRWGGGGMAIPFFFFFFFGGKCHFYYNTVRLFSSAVLYQVLQAIWGSQRQSPFPYPFHLSLVFLNHYFTASSDTRYWSTTILSAHLLIAFLTLCPPVILALIVIQSLTEIDYEFSFPSLRCVYWTLAAHLLLKYLPTISFKHWLLQGHRLKNKGDYLSIVFFSVM